MAGHNMLDDRQSETGSASGAALSGVDAIKTLRQARQVLGRNAGSVITDRKHAIAPVRRHLDFDGLHRGRFTLGIASKGSVDREAAVLRAAIFDGVLDEVLGDAQQFVAISGHDDGLGRVKRELHAILLGERSQCVGDVAHREGKVDRFIGSSMEMLLDARQ